MVLLFLSFLLHGLKGTVKYSVSDIAGSSFKVSFSLILGLKQLHHLLGIYV